MAKVQKGVDQTRAKLPILPVGQQTRWQRALPCRETGPAYMAIGTLRQLRRNAEANWETMKLRRL